MARARPDIAPIDVDGQTEGRRDGGRALLVACRRFPKLMVEMSHADHAHLALPSEPGHDVRQSDRIGSPGERDHDTRVRAEQMVSPSEVADAIDNPHRH